MKKIILLAISLVMISCQDDINNLNEGIDIKDHLEFNSYEEVSSYVENILGLDDDEITQFEKASGFESYYSKSERIYDLLRNKQFETQEEIFSAVSEYKGYVEIVEDNGEFEAVIPLSKSVLKYVINEDQIFQLGNSLYKVFSKSVVKAGIQNYKSLSRLNEKDLQLIDNNSEFEARMLNNTAMHKSLDTNNAGWGDVDMSASNKYRVKLELYYTNVWPYNVSDISVEHTVTPQKRILGIYWNNAAKINAEIKYRADYEDDAGDEQTVVKTYNIVNVVDDKIYLRNHIWLYQGIVGTSVFHFRGYDCTATTDRISDSADLEEDKSEI